MCSRDSSHGTISWGAFQAPFSQAAAVEDFEAAKNGLVNFARKVKV
jgi:hypothetical protein